MNQPSWLLAVVALASLAGSARAADGKTSMSASARTTHQSAAEIEDIGEIDETEGFRSFREKVRVRVSANGQYTTSALLNGNHNSSDFLFLPTIEVGFHTPLGRQFSFDLAARVESVVYARYDERSFIGYSANATLDYHPKPGLPRLYASVEPYRYDSYDGGNLLSSAIGFTGGTDWGVPFNAGRTLAFFGTSFTGYVSDPSIDNRLAYRGVLGVAHQLRSNLTGQLYYTYQYSDFTDFDRHDSRHTVAGNLVYQFTQKVFGSVTTSFVDNESSQNNASFQGFNAGLGMTVQF